MKLRIKHYYLALLAIILILQLFTIVGIKHTASPPYGGDLYRDRGFTVHIRESGEFYSDPYFDGEYAFYPNFGYTLGAIIAATGMNVDIVLIYFTFLLTPIFFYYLYKLGTELTKDKIFGLIMAVSYFVAVRFLLMKHTNNLGYMFLIIYLYYLMKVLNGKDKFITKDKVFAGIALGLVALSHYIPLIIAIILTLSLGFEIIYKRKKFVDYIKRFSFPILLGIAISMIFFLPVIINYQLHTANPSNEYGFADVNLLDFFWVASLVIGNYLNFSFIQDFGTRSLAQSIVGIIGIAGIFFCIRNFKKIQFRIPIYWLIGSALVTGHHLITRPLFDFWIIPGHTFSATKIALLIMFVYGLRFFYLMLKKVVNKKVFFAITACLLLLLIIFQFNHSYNTKWNQYGRKWDDSIKIYYDIGDWILANTDNDDIFISNDESAFMVNAMSGRKLVFVRRTHAFPYIDVEKRYADGVAILFCQDRKIADELVSRYDVKYLYIDQYLLQSAIIVNPDYHELLDNCGIQYTQSMERLDPATATAALYPSLVVEPQEITLLNISTPIKEFKVMDNTIGIIYKIG